MDKRVGAGNNNALPAIHAGKTFVLKHTLDCAEDNVSAAEKVFLFDIPAGTLVKDLAVEVETVEGGTLTIDVGDYSDTDTAVDADGYIDGMNGNSLGASKASDLTLANGAAIGDAHTFSPAYWNGKYYRTAAIIAALFNNAADAAKIHFSAVCVKC